MKLISAVRRYRNVVMIGITALLLIMIVVNALHQRWRAMEADAIINQYAIDIERSKPGGPDSGGLSSPDSSDEDFDLPQDKNLPFTIVLSVCNRWGVARADFTILLSGYARTHPTDPIGSADVISWMVAVEDPKNPGSWLLVSPETQDQKIQKLWYSRVLEVLADPLPRCRGADERLKKSPQPRRHSTRPDTLVASGPFY